MVCVYRSQRYGRGRCYLCCIVIDDTTNGHGPGNVCRGNRRGRRDTT